MVATFLKKKNSLIFFQLQNIPEKKINYQFYQGYFKISLNNVLDSEKFFETVVTFYGKINATKYRSYISIKKNEILSLKNITKVHK